MLQTPFGTIRVALDGDSISYSASAVAPAHPFPDIDGAFLVDWHYSRDGKPHELICCLDHSDPNGSNESGEHLEAISFYIGTGKLTIGCEGDDDHPEDYDYNIEYLPHGLAVQMTPATNSRLFRFGVAWLEHCSDDNDTQTWFAADPTITGQG